MTKAEVEKWPSKKELLERIRALDGKAVRAIEPAPKPKKKWWQWWKKSIR